MNQKAKKWLKLLSVGIFALTVAIPTTYAYTTDTTTRHQTNHPCEYLRSTNCDFGDGFFGYPVCIREDHPLRNCHNNEIDADDDGITQGFIDLFICRPDPNSNRPCPYGDEYIDQDFTGVGDQYVDTSYNSVGDQHITTTHATGVGDQYIDRTYTTTGIGNQFIDNTFTPENQFVLKTHATGVGDQYIDRTYTTTGVGNQFIDNTTTSTGVGDQYIDRTYAF